MTIFKNSLTYYLKAVDSFWNCPGIQKIKEKRFDYSMKSY